MPSLLSKLHLQTQHLYRNVSFNYPSTKTDRSALSDVSFTIQPGNLVVIVGSNGGGKTTIIKLLSRFYDVDAGTIFVDGIPIQEYRMEELRKGIAMLTQEHDLFPVSIQEDVALGSPDKSAIRDTEKLTESLRLSGAEHIVNNFSEGINTILEPVSNGYVSFDGDRDEELQAIYKSFAKPTSVSGVSTFLSYCLCQTHYNVALRWRKTTTGRVSAHFYCSRPLCMKELPGHAHSCASCPHQ